MCPDGSFGGGLKWIESVMPVRDERGEERLLARLAAGTGLTTTREWHLALFNDESQAFESLVRWEIHDGHDSAHPFRARVDGVEYCYLYPNYRVRADVAAFRELKNYEAFTCIASDGGVRGAETEVDRDGSGRARYSWRAGAERLQSGRLRKLIKAGKLDRGESWLQLHDIESGAVVEGGRGSAFWNEYRRRWVMIISGEPGDVWFSEADLPTGPWVYARRVAVHGRYNFYNPTQHPFFDEEKGRFIYFEGTYTASFSGAPAKTPRYDYNQLMYRLDLADSRLELPVPVYHLKGETTSSRYLLRETVDAQQAWEQVEGISFMALPPRSHAPGLIPIFADKGQWHTNAPPSASAPLFFALAITDAGSSSNLLHEVLRDEQGTATLSRLEKFR
jgi:hypothetical protein